MTGWSGVRTFVSNLRSSLLLWTGEQKTSQKSRVEGQKESSQKSEEALQSSDLAQSPDDTSPTLDCLRIRSSTFAARTARSMHYG